MHTHITFVSGQHAPVLTVIDALCQEDDPIDKVVAIFSPETKDKWDLIKSNLWDELVCETVELDGTDIPKIREKFHELAVEMKDVDKLTVNLTCGTKPWSLFAALEMQSMPNATLYYVDMNNTLFNVTNGESCKVEPFNVDKVRSKSTPLSAYTAKEVEDLKSIEVVRRVDPQSFHALTDKPNENKKTAKVGMLSFSTNDNKKYVLRAGSDSYELTSPKVKSLLFNTGWFEFKIAKYIEACSWKNAEGKEVHPTDIRLNSRILNKSGADLNEIDIRFDAGGRQFFVEVKTSIKHHTDLDKFNTVVDRVAGAGALKLFVTEGVINDQAQVKCESCGIEYYRTQYSDGPSKGKPKDEQTIVKEISEILARLYVKKNV